jgi:hypothetical protein
MLPEVGFAQLYATDDQNVYQNFNLVGIRPVDGGAVCGN